MQKSIVIITGILLTACATSRLMTPTQADADRIQIKYPGYTLAELNQGKSLFEKHCGTCHAYQKPASHSEEEWTKIVPGMSQKVNEKEGNVLDAKASDMILRYVLTMRGA